MVLSFQGIQQERRRCRGTAQDSGRIMGRRPLWAATAPVAVPACGVPEAQGGRPAPLVAVLGGGQLGRMLALAGIPLGLRFRFLDPSPDACAVEVGELLVGPYDDEALLDRLV